LVDVIHAWSPRAAFPLVKVNCAAIPETLLEAELFGHERGAFTGAVQQRIGRFEQATGGTIFLDEVGETYPGMQVRLLRVLQDGEVRPLGSSETRRVDVRIIAATNRNLRRDVEEGRFREDLYYRLSVLPVRLPALRDRLSDLEALAESLLESIAARTGLPTSVHVAEDADELALLPGAEELTTLLAVEAWATGGDYDFVVVDCAPTGAALRLLTLPEMARAAGLRVVFVDVDPRTFNMVPEALEQALTSRTRVVVPTHVYGLPCDMDEVIAIARRRAADGPHAVHAAAAFSLVVVAQTMNLPSPSEVSPELALGATALIATIPQRPIRASNTRV